MAIKSRIGLFFPRMNRNVETIIRGIADYMNIHGPRIILMEHHGDILTDALTDRNSVDGVILDSYPDLSPARAITAAGIACVDVAQYPHAESIAHIIPDDYAIGAAAARHFLDQRFKHFAYCGIERSAFSDARAAGFVDTVGCAGHSCAILQNANLPWGSLYDQWERRAEAWLITLPRPTALLVCTDFLARHTVNACHHGGLHIPRDIAIAAVDNTEWICETLYPTLTSVPVDARRAGYEAMTLLTRLIAGEPIPSEPVRIAPLPIMVRRSSDMLVTEDEDVAAALRYIRDHAGEPIGVNDVLATVLVSRRSLELRFRREIRRGIWQEIRRAHVEQAKRLLATTHLPMAQITYHSGFTNSQRFNTVFRQLTRMTPTTYRRSLGRGEGNRR